AKYLVTGTVGGIVTLGSLMALRTVTDLPLVSAYSLAVELAILNNFLLNEFWTFADATTARAGLRTRVIRFLRFNGTCVWGAVFNVGTFLALGEMVQLPVALAGLAGVAVGYVWNYGVNANATWLDLFPPQARRAAAGSGERRTQDRRSLPSPGYYHEAYTHGNRVQRFWHRGKFGRVLSRPRQHPILDVGSGPGVLSALLKNGSHLVVSLDRSFEVIRFAKQTHPEICGVVADVRHLPFRPGRFRTIFFVEVIEHIPAQWSLDVLRELRDMLHPAGRLILTTPNYRSLWPALEWMVSRWGPIDYTKEHVNHYSLTRLEGEVGEAGLRVIGAESFFLLSPFVACLSEPAALKLLDLERRRCGRLGAIRKAMDVERRWCGRWGSLLLLEVGRS
ncbi:MAG: GtrA family protein, partial [candidate division NC10 bacterium]|nr:GtrA family protein [candidate division NC10 bacterium]